MVRSSADRLLHLINAILDFSKIEAGKLELISAPFLPHKDITETLKILAISAAEKGIDLRVNFSDDIPERLSGDSDRLCQIILNLVGNAIKFTDSGSVVLSVEPDPEQTPPPGKTVLHFSVQDTGIGIPADKFEAVFTAFGQVGTTRLSSHQGTGLGLVIAAEMIELMGGRIWVDSTPGIGSTFHFTAGFSVPPDDSTGTDKPTRHLCRQESDGSTPLSILLVEDEFINRTLAATLLEKSGWRVHTAENGREALHLLEQEDVDLILMDVQMPDLDGFAATRIIREQEKGTGTHLPIIAMTAYAVKGDREKCIDAGMDGYISKPISPDQLHAEIKSVLARG